jgi:eukaryotic-like serine/threonine-protein kinase
MHPPYVVPTVIGERYAVVRTLGAGGFATVYLARDSRLGRDVAVKVLKELWLAGSAQERFEREIAVQERLHHPNIIPILDRGVTGDGLFFVMPVADEGTLETSIRRDGPLSLHAVRRLATEMTEALAYAHDQGVVHRDVKPSNILLSGGHGWLGDFGILRLMESTDNARLTPSGISIGSPAYMSPEQLLGDTDVDFRTDIYSLGLVLYEAVAGVAAFVGRDAQSSAHMRLSTQPVPVRAHRPELDVALENTIMRALQRDASARWQSAREMCPDVQSLARELRPHM